MKRTNKIYKIILTGFCLLLLCFFYSCKTTRKTVVTNNEIDEKDWFEFNNYIVEASKQKMLGNYNEAAQLYQKCIKINPLNATSYYEASNLQLAQGDWVNAMKLSEFSVRLDPSNMWYQLQLANLYQRNGMLEKSANIFKLLIKRYPDKIEFYYNLATIYTSLKQIKDAIRILDEAEKQIGITEPVSLEKERLYLLIGNAKKSIAEIKKLVDAYPQEPRFYGVLAETYVQNQQFDLALETYKKLLEVDKNNGLAHLSLADFYRLTNNPEKSFEELKLAFASRDVDVDIKVKMLMNFIDYTQGNDDMNDKAYKLIEILLITHPDDPKAHTLYADYLIKDKKYAEALVQLQIVIKSEKDKYLIWEQLLYLESQLANNKNLYEESKEAMELFPSQPTAFMFNGLASFELKNYTEAIDVFNKGLNLTVDNNPLKIQFLTYLGEAYYRNKQYSESDRAFDKLLRLDPENVVIMNNYSYYLALRNDSLEKAERMIKKVIEIIPENATYLDTYAWVLYKLNKFDDAKLNIEKALKDGTSHSAVIIEHYGDIIYKLGEKQKALEQWKKALEKGKGSEFLEQKINEERLIE